MKKTIKIKFIECFIIVLFFSGVCCSTFKKGTSDFSRNKSFQKIDTTNLDLKKFALSITRNEKTNIGKAKKLLGWLSHNFGWKATDYKTRTVAEIIARNGGNCYELAKTYMALIKEIGIEYRPTAEINIQPENERRQNTAKAKIDQNGFSMSVFGLQHNDHRWVEIYDEKYNTWIPVDPTMNTFGVKEFMTARMSFTFPRMTIDTSITKDMIVPIGIYITDKKGNVIESTSKRYLIDEFNKFYRGKLSGLPSWNNWVTQIIIIDEKCKNAFLGKENLHNYAKQIEAILITYYKMLEEYNMKN